MDFVGWLDDFSSTGGYFDALGGQTRTHVNIAENIYGTPPKTGQFKRCPGGADIVLPRPLERAERRGAAAAGMHRGPQGGAMRRLLTVPLVVLAAAGAARSRSPGAGRRRGGKRSYRIVFDNAFGLVEGGDFRVGGVRAGQTSGFDVQDVADRARPRRWSPPR